MAAKIQPVPVEHIENAIVLVRGQKVLLDRDLAALYGVETRALNQAVRRNAARFPADFMFKLSRQDIERISQSVISSSSLRFSKSVHVFTEQGVAMLSSALHSPRAIQVNIEIMRAFVRLRQMLATNTGLEKKLTALERKYDRKFKVVFDAIRELMSDDEVEESQPRREIGFHAVPSASKEILQRAQRKQS